MNINLFKNISREKITFLKDIDKSLNVYLNGEFKYFKIPLMDSKGIYDFIDEIDGDKLYLVIPFITHSCKLDDPFIILSRQILISRYSSEITIRNYLDYQLNKSIIDFGMSGLDKFYLIFKYKKVKLELKTHY
jgi:hypothetical protein